MLRVPPRVLSIPEFCRFQFAPPTSFSYQGSLGSCASLPPPASTCLAKGLHSAEASFLCTWHKQLFLLSLFLMLPRELADHFLLTDITPPRNNRLPLSVLLIKRHFSLLPHHGSSQSQYASTSLPRSARAAGSQNPQGAKRGHVATNWRPSCTRMLSLSCERFCLAPVLPRAPLTAFE